MLVDLDLEALENIFKDGVKEILARVVGGVRGIRKKTWFIAVKAAINAYQKTLNEDFLPVLKQDFGRKMTVKFSGGKMDDEDKNKLKMFMEMVKKSNVTSVKEELVRKLDNIKVEGENEELIEKIESIKKVVADGHEWILRRVELHIRSVISDEMFKKTVERSKIEVMLYNFVDGEVPDSVKKMFANGMDAVPNTRMSKKEIDMRVEEALLEYLVRLGRRSICGTSVLQSTGVPDWIRKVKLLNVDQESRQFLEVLENTLPALYAELDLVYREVDLESKEETVKGLEKDGCVLVLCDKGMGMSLFTLEAMRKADEALMKQLGAVRMNKTKEEIIETVMVEIEKFEKGLMPEHKEYLDVTYGDRQNDMKNAAFPFLKSLHKIQKMTEEEIKNKDLKNIKFRPVVDAKLWLTRGYSGVVMQMMRQACNTLVRNGGKVMRKMKPKDGWRFAVEVADYTVEEDLDVMVTADIQEAYTNITADMIKRSIEIVCKFVRFEDWSIDLMKKLIDLVLGQNYAETSGGLFKFKEVLPMGYKLSGEALDIVALAQEMMSLYHLEEDQNRKLQVRIGELRNYPEEFVKNNVQAELSMSKGVKAFRRYVDDTHSQIAGTLEEILNGVLALGFMYPESLVISMDLHIWHSSFLDVFVWKNILSRSVSTVMKKSSEVPVGHVRKGSNHPEKYKLQSLLGEMLRGRRIASDKEMIELSDKCISHEFQSISYSRWDVQNAMEEAKKKVEEIYSGMFVKITEDGERRYYRYGGGLVYNKNYKYGDVLLNYIERIKPHGEPGIILLPDVKIKRLAFTKKRYLERQVEDKKKSKP